MNRQTTFKGVHLPALLGTVLATILLAWGGYARLTFDTDPQQVKKIVKRIGAELMEDELVGGGLLEPPKSQGVIQMEDSAMILRVKFKAIPGRQFVIRRELLHRIRAAFEEAGIRFASREVTVRVQEDATQAEKQDAIGAAASRAIEAEQPAP